MTTAMLRAQKQMVETLQRQIDTMRRGETQIAEVEALTEEWTKDEDDDG